MPEELCGRSHGRSLSGGGRPDSSLGRPGSAIVKTVWGTGAKINQRNKTMSSTGLRDGSTRVTGKPERGCLQHGHVSLRHLSSGCLARSLARSLSLSLSLSSAFRRDSSTLRRALPLRVSFS